MALLAAGRRLPVVRDLSAFASITTREAGIGSSWLYSALMSTSSSSSGTGGSGGAAAPADGTAAGKPAGDGKEPAVPTTAPATTADTASTSSAPATRDDEEEWTEVVHSSGAVYYWNQRTGETTQLGQPKPGSRGSGEGGGESAGAGSGGSGAGGGSGGESGAGARGAGGGAGVHSDPRAEAPIEDKTGTYAAVGIIVGAFLGWVSQFV